MDEATTGKYGGIRLLDNLKFKTAVKPNSMWATSLGTKFRASLESI
jgi:hypothetical protein